MGFCCCTFCDFYTHWKPKYYLYLYLETGMNGAMYQTTNINSDRLWGLRSELLKTSSSAFSLLPNQIQPSDSISEETNATMSLATLCFGKSKKHKSPNMQNVKSQTALKVVTSLAPALNWIKFSSQKQLRLHEDGFSYLCFFTSCLVSLWALSLRIYPRREAVCNSWKSQTELSIIRIIATILFPNVMQFLRKPLFLANALDTFPSIVAN